jgi:hypothetical protein
MLKAEKTTVNWDPAKKQWHVRIQIGEEVIKRTLEKTPENTAKDEGYEVDAAQVVIQR